MSDTDLCMCYFDSMQAFGTMGIIFPLVIPTMCNLSKCDEDSVLQSSAAILASSVFGNGVCALVVLNAQ